MLKFPQQSITSFASHPLRPRLSSPALSPREPVTPMRLRVDSDAFTPSQAARGQYGQWRVEQSGGEVGSAKAPGAGHCFGMFWAIVKKKWSLSSCLPLA